MLDAYEGELRIWPVNPRMHKADAAQGPEVIQRVDEPDLTGGDAPKPKGRSALGTQNKRDCDRARPRSQSTRASLGLQQAYALGMSDEEPKPIEPIAPRVPITEEVALRTWTADCWTCRYCDELVFFPPAFRAMARRFGNHGYYHPNWKADQSPLLIRRGASVDHVVAVTRGGAHAAENFVTGCWECNLKKSNYEGWAPKPQRAGLTWDGLLAVFKGLAAAEPDATERRWLRAIHALGL